MNFGGVDGFNLFYYVLVWDSFKNLYSNGLFAQRFQAHRELSSSNYRCRSEVLESTTYMSLGGERPEIKIGN
jgi:hypothetical protein